MLIFNMILGNLINLFICAGVVHPKAIEYLKGRNRKYLIIPRYLYFPIYIKLKYFDFLYNTPSVAHMSYFLSVLLNHKNIIFIDLIMVDFSFNFSSFCIWKFVFDDIG